MYTHVVIHNVIKNCIIIEFFFLKVMSTDTHPDTSENQAAESSSGLALNLFTDETLQKLSDGFLEILLPEVTRVQRSLEELM